jgi:TPR repeat protein
MFKKILIISLCLFISSCVTERGSDGENIDTSQMSSADTFTMGMRYLLGKGVPQNNQKAVAYLEKSAETGYPYAENELGYLYIAGRGVPQNYETAFKWYQKSANHGLASAQYNLGLMYLNGVGTPVDKALAKKYFQEAAQRGFSPASRALAGI